MTDFIFDLQRFATTEIDAGSSVTIDGVTYTAIEDTQLNLDDDGKVKGIASGSVQAVIAGAESSSTLTLDATDGSTDFTLTSNGEVLTLTKVLPFELDNGTFTFAGNVLTAAKGSDLGIGTGRTYADGSIVFGHDYADTDITYTITDTTLTEETEQETITFTASLGEQSRSITTFVNGKIINGVADGKFTGGFTITKDSSMGLVLGDYTLKATANSDATSQILVDSNGANITPGSGDGKLNVALTRNGNEIFAGELECTSGKITLGYDKAVTFEKGTAFNFTWNNYVSTIIATEDATTAISLTDNGITFTPGENDGGLQLVLKKDGKTVFGGILNITNGTITFDSDEKKFSFSEGTKISLGIGTDGSQAMDIEIVDGDASFKTEANSDGSFTITPDENDGSIDITLKRDGETVFKNTVTVNGAMTINPVTDLLTLKDGTNFSLAFNNYTLTATAQGDASSTISLGVNGISITPQEGDGKLNLSLGSKDGSMSADIEVLSGGFLFGTNGALTVTEGTELQIKFSDDYIINFKATDAAGGAISIGADGLSFAPNSEDGGLQLSVTRNGETRSASLDVTGSLTYKLDGSISLTKDTVVKNVFEDGNILTITANTDASGSIHFNPQNGLNITPATADALTVALTTGDLEVAQFSSITGTINYSGGLVTASDGTQADLLVYGEWATKLSTSGGTASLQFTGDRTVYTANEDATFVLDYLDGSTVEIQNGSFSDIYATETADAIELISAGSIFNCNDDEFTFTLETAGNYTLNGISVTTTKDNVQVVLSDYDTVQFAADAPVKISTVDGGKLFMINETDDAIQFSTQKSDNIEVSDGTITFDNETKKVSITKDTEITLTKDEQALTFTTPEDISATYKLEEDVLYFDLDSDSTAKVSIAGGEQTITGDLNFGGVLSYSPSTGTFGLTGANSSHGNSQNTFLQFTTDNGYGVKMATNDTTVVFIPKFSDGKLEFNFPNENKHEMLFTLSKDGETTFENQITIGGTVGFDTASQEISLTKDTVLTLTQGKNALEVKALNDAGGQLTFTDAGIRFAPNAGDGQLELNFVNEGRKANIDVTGAIVLGENGKLSLEDGTEVNISWEDGAKLKLTSKGSTGSIGLDAEKGIKITSDDENLSMDLTTATGDETHLSGIKGTIYYNAGSVSFDDNSTITATTTLGGEPVLMTLETISGTGHLDFASNGVIYSADTGAMKITWAKGDVESTFTVNSGSVQIGHNLFKIAKGTELSTDLKDFIPALYFTTSEAGNYTINGQTITTTAEGLKLTATDDYMTFVTSDDVVEYDGMTFAGAGNVSLSPDNVVLGAGVEAKGFGKDKSFVLAEAGQVTADERIFDLTQVYLQRDGENIPVPLRITVSGTEDGFIFSRTTTEESEEYCEADPPIVGANFTEKFVAEGDSSYRTRTDPIGLQEVIGISADTTITGGAIFDGEPSYNYFDIVTETNGKFVIGERVYVISEGSTVGTKLTAHFDENGQAYARGVKNLNGTVSGDFSAYKEFKVNENPALKLYGDTDISIVADNSGYEILGLDEGKILRVSAKDTYIVNGTTINAGAGDFIVGTGDNEAYLLAVNNNNNTILTGTEFDDIMANNGTNVTINALGGNDYIFNVARVDSETGEVISNPDNVLINGGAGNDSIAADGDSASIDAGEGNDSIEVNGDNTSVNAGDGSNQIKITGKNEVILLKGRNTVEGFNTGFGDGSDTIYIKPENDPAGVEFLEDGLTFGNDTASLTLSDVNTTAKVNLFHENRDVLNKGVFIAAGDWYTVENSDLSVNAGEEVYFVGTAAEPTAGVDFSNITADLNITMDTEWEIPDNTMWVNGIYSLKGGAGNTTITGSDKDDTILAGSGNTTIDAGAGNNQIKLSDGSAAVVFNGQTTVEGFKTGFGEGSDTVYIPKDYPGVDFKDGVLTFYDDTNSLTFKDITSTAQINTYYAENGTTAQQVYIADDEWYKVADGEAQYYIGATAKKNHGIDFSGVTRSINVTLDTADEANEDSTWISNVYSIRGSDGLTTITGSEKSDTIIAGSGNTTINAAGGDDLISLTGSSALIQYAEGDGNDTVLGFDSNATLSPAGTYTTLVSGNDLIVTVGESKITLKDAASLPYPNISSSNLIVQLAETILKRTALGYPAMAAEVFDPEGNYGDEPTNYVDKEDWTVTSADDLKLHAVHYTPENSNDKWVVLIHGYGNNHTAMYIYAESYLANGYNVLMIDQRAAGESEGTWLTMGAAESADVALWTQEIARRNSNAKITLHGVSMGAATAMLAAARSDTTNVTSIVEDCGYSDVMETFDTIITNNPQLGISPEVIPYLDPVAAGLTGYYLHDAAPIDSISSVKMPSLFISGDADTVAPVSMLEELYDASGAEVKETFVVEGAPHALAASIKPVEYNNAVFRFVAEADGEGWDTSNVTDNISLRGTKYNDTITNTGEGVTIQTGEGDDSISNTADNVSIDAGAGNDTIYNHADNITIDGGAGNDSISNNSDNVVFIWSGGDDTIDGFKEDSVLSIGSAYSTQESGDDVIVNVGDNKIVLKGASTLDNVDIIGAEGVTVINYNANSLVSGTSDNDSITNYGTNSTIQALDGMDTIYNEFAAAIIDGGKGNDSINNLDANNTSINAGAGNDTIRNEHSYNVTLEGGSGNDKIIVVKGDHTTIDGGAGDDTILGETLEGEPPTWAMGGYAAIDGGSGDDFINPIYSDSASINGGTGNDTIINEGNDSTINGGAGNDIISLHGADLDNDVIKYEVGDGNDTIYGFNETSKLSITADTEYSTVESGSDVIVNVGSNKITIADGAGLSTINITNEEITPLNLTNTVNNTIITGTEESDTIRNSGGEVTIAGLAADDTITNSGANSSVNGGAGSDRIVNSGANSTVLGEYGNDSLTNSADKVLIDGSYGNDTITNSGSSVTISGGKGFNYIENTGDNVQFNFEGGIDTIDGFGENSTLSLASDDYETLYGIKDIYVISGNDIAILENAFLMYDSLNINDKTIEVEDKVIYLLPGDDEATIGRSNVSIVSGEGNDKISLTSDATNNVIQYAAGDGNDTIYGYNETSRLSISGDYTFVKDGDDVIFKVGNESIKVVDASSVIDLNFEDGESIVLTKKGAYSVDGKVFELTKNVPSGVTITGEPDGFTSGVTHDGKTFVEEFIAAGDDSYNVSINGKGVQTISGIDAGTTVTSSATEDGEEADSEIYIVTEDAGSYTFNDTKITTTKDNAVIRLHPEAMAFEAIDGIVYDGKTFSGDGRIAVSLDSVILGSSVSATGFDKGESFILAQKGTTTVDGRVFELTEDISDGMTIEGADNEYTFSHTITDKETSAGGLTSGYAGKVFSEEVHVEGDETYSLQADTFGLKKVSGISDGATLSGGNPSIDGSGDKKIGQRFYVETDTEGTFTIGEKAYSIGGDSNVLIEADFLPEKSYAGGFASLEGTVSGDFDGDEFYVNGNKPILVEGDDSIKVVGSSSGTKLYDISNGATLASLGGVKEVNTDSEGVFKFGTTANDSIAITVRGDDNVKFKLNSAELIENIDDVEGDLIFSETSNTLFINGMGGTFEGDFSSIGAYDNSLYIHDASDGSNLETDNADKIWLQMVGENFTLNGNRLTLTDDSDGIWLRDKEIVGLDKNASLQVSKGGVYTSGTTSLKAKAGDVIVGLENNDAYIYNANRPPITSKTSNAEIINHFNPKNYTVASAAQNITLNGGDLAIVEDISAQVNITAGDDTIISQGENVNVSLTGGNTWLFPLGGKMTLEGYDAATGAGFNFAGTNIFAAVEDGYIDFNNGNLKFGSAQVDMGKSSELMNFYNIVGRQQKVGYASTSDSLDVSDKTDDLILVAKKNGTVISGSGNDTILAHGGNLIDGGAGKNLVKSDGAGSNIVLNGKTTVEGFKTGWGNGDTVYINAESDPAVDFKTGGLTFYDGGDIMELSGVTDTAQVNLYYEELDRLRRGVFIAKNDWYEVSEDDLADSSGAGVDTESGIYFVGTSATKNHGIDFSGVTKDLNIMLNTDYKSTTAEFWVNNIHSIKGGAGNTTIVGSDKNDTILAGSGEQSINGGAGQDKMYGNTAADKNVATFFYMAGDGRDSIENFDFMTNAQDVTADKVQLEDNSNISEVLLRGDDVMIKVDGADGFLMLEGAQGKSFRVNDDLIAKVDTNVEFDGFTNAYVGIGTKATLTVGKGAGDVEVWLSDDSLEYHGTMYDGNFAVLDASKSDGSNILAGNELNNSIVGGTGQNSLWGGYSSENDTLVGGAGQNTFFYLQGNGKDKIQNAHAGDEIILDDITLDQISDANITAGGVILNFNDGGSLTIDGTADVTYQLADGLRYSADHATKDWVQK